MTDLLDLIRFNPEYAEGQSEAERDFGKGLLKQRNFGPLPTWWDAAQRTLETKFDIEFEDVEASDKETGGALICRCIGYNNRMRELITEKFGSDVVSIAGVEAQEAEGSP